MPRGIAQRSGAVIPRSCIGKTLWPQVPPRADARRSRFSSKKVPRRVRELATAVRSSFGAGRELQARKEAAIQDGESSTRTEIKQAPRSRER